MSHEKYISELKRILERHPASHNHGPIHDLLDKFDVNDGDIENLHAQIHSQLAMPAPRGRWRTVKVKLGITHSSLADELTTAINLHVIFIEHIKVRQNSSGSASASHRGSARFAIADHTDDSQSSRSSLISARSALIRQGLQEDGAVMDPETFKKCLLSTFFKCGKRYSDNPAEAEEISRQEITQTNSLLRLIDTYHRLYDAHEKNPTDKEKQYLGLRLSIMRKWTTSEGYPSLSKSISRLDKYLDGQIIDLHRPHSRVNELSIDDQEFLNWLGVVSEAFHASECPYGMSLALKIIDLTLIPFEEDIDQIELENRLNAFKRIIEDFKLFFIGAEALPGEPTNQGLAGINIGSKNRNAFLSQVMLLSQPIQTNPVEKLTSILTALREILLEIHNEVAGLLAPNLQSRMSELNEIRIYNKKQEEKFNLAYLEVVVPLHRPSSRSSRHPSQRNSGRAASSSPSSSGRTHSDRTLLNLHRSNSTQSLAPSAGGNPTSSQDQAAATLAENSEASRSGSIQSQLASSRRKYT